MQKPARFRSRFRKVKAVSIFGWPKTVNPTCGYDHRPDFHINIQTCWRRTICQNRRLAASPQGITALAVQGARVAGGDLKMQRILKRRPSRQARSSHLDGTETTFCSERDYSVCLSPRQIGIGLTYTNGMRPNTISVFASTTQRIFSKITTISLLSISSCFISSSQYT